MAIVRDFSKQVIIFWWSPYDGGGCQLLSHNLQLVFDFNLPIMWKEKVAVGMDYSWNKKKIARMGDIWQTDL